MVVRQVRAGPGGEGVGAGQHRQLVVVVVVAAAAAVVVVTAEHTTAVLSHLLLLVASWQAPDCNKRVNI